jgi:hypothetical protein
MFGGVYPLDIQPPPKKRAKIVYIFNLDPKNKPGSHWVSVFLSSKLAEYFDPLGLPPNLNI